MPADKFTTPEINLLPGDDLSTRAGGRVLKWALSWGKKIIIITEFVVILAFVSRFKLDTDSADLSDNISHQKVVLDNEAEFETQFRTLSNRLAKYASVGKITSVNTVYDKAKALIPSGVTTSQISVNGKIVSFGGSGTDETLSKMAAAFKESPDFSNVDMQRVAKKGESGEVDFSLTTQFVMP